MGGALLWGMGWGGGGGGLNKLNCLICFLVSPLPLQLSTGKYIYCHSHTTPVPHFMLTSYISQQILLAVLIIYYKTTSWILFVLFLFGTEVVSILLALYSDCTIPPMGDIVNWDLIILSLYSTVQRLGLSFLRPISRCLPKEFSNLSWEKISVNTYFIPALSKNCTHCIKDFDVIISPSWVCQDKNIFVSFGVEFQGRTWMFSFQSDKYLRKTFCNQTNRSSFRST